MIEKKEDVIDKHDLVKSEADYYLPAHSSKYDLMLTIKDSVLAVNAGIDESNADNRYILWPENVQKVTNEIWEFLRKEYCLKGR